LKVAIVSSLYEPLGFGGAERVAQSVAEMLAAQGHGVHVITLGKGDRAERVERNGVQVRTVPLRNLYWPFPVSPAGSAGKIAWHAIDAWNPAMAGAVGRLLDEIRPEVVNTHNLAGFSAAVWQAAARRELPLAHTLHDHYLLCPYSTMFRDGANCARPCLRCRAVTVPRRALTRHVDAVIGVSRFILDRHLGEGLFEDAHASVVYSGYRAPESVVRPSSGPLKVGFLGSLMPNKGLDRLVDSFLRLPQDAAELRIGGKGDPAYEAALKNRTAARKDVRWLGVVRAEEFLPALDVLVVPSLVQEAMGRVVVEAFAHGVPVIAANRGGIPELLRDECGWLYDPDDAARLPALLLQALQKRDALAAMRGAALEAGRRYSLEAMLAGYLAAYQAASER
jgi:glycosyltransferase involved in cell wall biosynthesis